MEPRVNCAKYFKNINESRSCYFGTQTEYEPIFELTRSQEPELNLPIPRSLRETNPSIEGSFPFLLPGFEEDLDIEVLKATSLSCQEVCIIRRIFFVSVAVILLQAIREEELQAYDAYEGRFGGVEVKTDKVKKEATKKKGVIDLHL